MGLITPASSPSLNAYCPLSTLGDRPLTIPSTPLPSSRLSFFCCVARGRNCVTTKIAQASEWTVRRWDVRRRAQFLPLSNRFASCSCTTAAPAPPPHRLPSRKISLRRRQKKPKRHRSVRPCPGTARPFFSFLHQLVAVDIWLPPLHPSRPFFFFFLVPRYFCGILSHTLHSTSRPVPPSICRPLSLRRCISHSLLDLFNPLIWWFDRLV